MTDNVIRIEMDDAAVTEVTSRQWSEEISVKGGDLKDTVGRLAKEATVRKITIKNADGRKVLSIPLALGALGVLVLGPWTAVVLGAAWVGHYSILIEYEEVAQTRTVDQIEEAIVIEKGSADGS